MVNTITTKLGTTRAGERSRIWIEGDRLVQAGFTVGQRYNVQWLERSALLVLDPKGSKKVSGKGAHPIIDITGQKVIARFAMGTHVVAIFDKDTIAIFRGAN